MTVSSTTNRKAYAGDDASTSFDTSPVVFFDTSDLEIRVTDDTTGSETLLVESTDYSVSGGDGTTGTVNLAGGASPWGALLSGTTLVILRVLPLTQEADFVQNDGSDAEVQETALDKQVMIAQQLAEVTDRALTLPAGDTSGSDTEVPAVEDRAGTVLGFDALGKLTALIAQTGTSLVDLVASTGSTLVGWIQAGTGAVLRTVQDKLRDVVSVKDFGATGDGVTDDTAAIQAALLASDEVYAPAGTFVVTSAVVMSAMNKRLHGAGIGITIIKNTGTGNAIEVKSAGGVDSTKLRNEVSNLTIQGNGSSLAGLYVYDVADSLFYNIESKSNGTKGISVEMCVDCTWSDIYSHDNGDDGFKLNAALKNSVEFLSNANQIRRLVSNTNTGNGLTIARSIANMIYGGELSANSNGCVISGGYRNKVDGPWIENNTTDGVRIEQSTSPTTISPDFNKIWGCMIAGTGNFTINQGERNSLMGNYLAGNLVISNAGSTPNTYLGADNKIVGTVTDNGNGTINLLSPTDMYWKSSGLKRWEVKVGSTVDHISDLSASQRYGMLGSLSLTTTFGTNVCGFKDIADAATTAAVSFGTQEPDASYNIMLGTWDVTGTPVADSHIAWITARATTGFTINLKTAPVATSTVRVFWFLVRV